MAQAKQQAVKVKVTGLGEKVFQPGEIALVTLKDEGDEDGMIYGPVWLFSAKALSGSSEGGVALREFGKHYEGEYELDGWYSKRTALKLARMLGARFEDS